jgi:hypothetical protein
MPNPVPDVVRAFVDRCVPGDAATPRGTKLVQRGEIRLDPERGWLPFTATQTLQADRTAFVWRARVRMAPLLTATVEDAFEDGVGRLDARLLGFIRVAHGRGPHVDVGEVQRYLAELPWNPLALLHNPELRFEELAPDLVRVSTERPAAEVVLRFDADGDVVGARTEARPRETDQQPWEGEFGEYRDFGELRAPARGAVRWDVPGAPFPYWRGEVTQLAFR